MDSSIENVPSEAVPTRLSSALAFAQKTAPKRWKSGYVYVIAGNSGTVKVGLTLSPSKRLTTIIANSGRPDLRVTLAIDCGNSAFEVETKCLRRLGSHCVHGEWFDVPPSEARRVVRDVVAELGADVMQAEGREAFDINDPPAWALKEVPHLAPQLPPAEAWRPMRFLSSKEYGPRRKRAPHFRYPRYPE